MIQSKKMKNHHIPFFGLRGHFHCVTLDDIITLNIANNSELAFLVITHLFDNRKSTISLVNNALETDLYLGIISNEERCNALRSIQKRRGEHVKPCVISKESNSEAKFYIK